MPSKSGVSTRSASCVAVYASIKFGSYTYQAINQDATLKEWMIRKVRDGGWDEFGLLTKGEDPDSSYWAGPRDGSMAERSRGTPAGDALKFAARGFRR